MEASTHRYHQYQVYLPGHIILALFFYIISYQPQVVQESTMPFDINDCCPSVRLLEVKLI